MPPITRWYITQVQLVGGTQLPLQHQRHISTGPCMWCVPRAHGHRIPHMCVPGGPPRARRRLEGDHAAARGLWGAVGGPGETGRWDPLVAAKVEGRVGGWGVQAGLLDVPCWVITFFVLRGVCVEKEGTSICCDIP